MSAYGMLTEIQKEVGRLLMDAALRGAPNQKELVELAGFLNKKSVYEIVPGVGHLEWLVRHKRTKALIWPK